MTQYDCNPPARCGWWLDSPQGPLYPKNRAMTADTSTVTPYGPAVRQSHPSLRSVIARLSPSPKQPIQTLLHRHTPSVGPIDSFRQTTDPFLSRIAPVDGCIYLMIPHTLTDRPSIPLCIEPIRPTQGLRSPRSSVSSFRISRSASNRREFSSCCRSKRCCASFSR